MQETINLLRRQAIALNKAADLLEESLEEVEAVATASRRTMICAGWKENGNHHQCHKEFTATGPRSLRCAECASKQRRANDAKYYSQRRDKAATPEE